MISKFFEYSAFRTFYPIDFASFNDKVSLYQEEPLSRTELKKIELIGSIQTEWISRLSIEGPLVTWNSIPYYRLGLINKTKNIYFNKLGHEWWFIVYFSRSGVIPKYYILDGFDDFYECLNFLII